jgi:hypothetical protein
MTILKRPNRLELSVIVGVGVAVWCLALAGIAKAQDPPPPPPVTLGPTGDFAVLSDAGPLSLGNHTLILGTGASLASTYAVLKIGDAQTRIQGDAIATQFELNPPPATITMLNYGHVTGACVTDGTTIPTSIFLHTGATCGSEVADPNSPLIGNLADAVDNEEIVDAAILCQEPTEMLPAIVLGAGKKMTIPVAAGLNVIVTPSITLGNSSVLTLSGGSADSVVLATTGSPGEGKINVGDSAKIVLAGLSPQNVWISSTPEPQGFNPPASAANASLILKNSSVINGTLHGGYTCSIGSGVTINGALICDYGLTAGNNLIVNFAPATGLSLPNCITDDPIEEDD